MKIKVRNPVRGLSERSLLKRGTVWSSREISVPPGSEGYRGGVENCDFCMLFWILPSQDASNAKFRDLPATGGRSLVPTTPVFPAEGAFEPLPFRHRSRKNRPRGHFDSALHRSPARPGAAGGGRLLALAGLWLQYLW